MSPILPRLRAFTLALVQLGVSADIIAQQSSQDPTKAEKQNALEEALRKLSNSDVAKSGIVDPDKAILQQGPVRLIDISVDLLTSVGTSTERDSNIKDLEGGGHDPRQRGFNLQAAEVSLMGAVDPYFTAETHLLYFIDPEGESQVELEEAFVTTTSLPYGLELEVGQFLTEFGRINPQHPHSWDYQDQPVILSRFFGEDGLRGVGARAGWLVPAPWFMQLHFGVQNADGEAMVSFSASDEVFDERPIAGRPFVDQDVRSLDDMLYHLRLENSWDLSEESTVLLGASALFGPNATGDDGDTQIYGLDLLLKHKPEDSFHGSSAVTWQSEFLFRDYHADSFVDEGDPTVIGDETSFGSESLKDWGLYTQLLYGIAPDWQLGLRYEYSSGDGDNFDSDTVSLTSNQVDPYRDTRQRFSPLISWRLSEYSRLRFQYNLDTTHWLDDDDAHSFWLGYEISFGAHPAHKY